MADEEKNENLEENEDSKKKKGKGSIIKWIVIMFVLVILTAAGFGGWKYYQSNMANQEKKVEEQKPLIGAIWPMGTMIVNLMDGNGERYLKAVVQVELTSQDCITELDVLKPKIVDNVLDLLSSKKYKEIVGYGGKQQLRDEIAMRVNSYLAKGRIKHVYFTEFVIQ